MYGLGAHSGLFLTFGSFVFTWFELGHQEAWARPDTLWNSPSLVCCFLASPPPPSLAWHPPTPAATALSFL